MSMYYSPSAGGFYDSALHGERRFLIDDPAWSRPLLELADLSWAPSEGQSEADRPVARVPDPDAVAPKIWIENTDCMLPTDARPVAEEIYVGLLQAQEQGKRIAPDDAGNPRAVDPPPPLPPSVVNRRQWRRALLAEGLTEQWEAAIDALPSPQREEAQIDWEDATDIRRDSELLSHLAPAMQWAAADLDRLFTLAASK